MDSKKPWQSKTILLNAIMGVCAALAVFFPGANIVSQYISSHMAAIGIVWSVLGMALRLITKDKISLID